MPLFLPSANIYQQTRAGQHANISKQNIKKYLPFYSHQRHILKYPPQNKTMKHSQEHSEFILLNITPSPHQKHQKPDVKLITYMNNENVFDLLIAVVFAMIPWLGGIGPKAQDLVIYFCLGEGRIIPQLHLTPKSCIAASIWSVYRRGGLRGGRSQEVRMVESRGGREASSGNLGGGVGRKEQETKGGGSHAVVTRGC